MDARVPKHSPYLGSGCAGPAVNHPYEDHGRHAATSSVAQLPLSGAPAFVVDPQEVDPRKVTQYPYVTGTSVLAVCYKDGVLIASDTLGAYGSTKRYKSVQRMVKVNDTCVVGASGEISDFQRIEELLNELEEEDFLAGDGIAITPRQIHAYLTRVMYNRRNKFDPLWNTLVVVGIDGAQPFCAMVSMIGVSFEDSYVCTGFASQLGLPLIRDAYRPDMDEESALDLLKTALKVCFYRDKNSINKFVVGKVSQAGVDFSVPFAVSTEWNYSVMQDPTRFCIGAW